MKNFLMVTLPFLLFSCQQKENKSTTVSSSDSIQVTQNAEESKIENRTENKQTGDTIFMNFKNEQNIYIAEGTVDSIHSRIYVKFKNEESGELNAKIMPPTGKGNIRFNQIIFPDKTSDGPFGMDMKIPLKQKGSYILVIGHSQMADNPFWGKFKVELENKKVAE
ncbi:hypothetical protein K6T82_11625 [Flavobacterium sp. 17A]|uniref:Uncharacterized protein n=1 Tax=Flavobacterium potami TaxID=2872310 RepID=A0A9X1HBH9_9FLAO|nr:hypothetical protein [Flavobacterium potami]MBZ4035419.1 hypothetical protein [Flavobacterium potami]